MISEMCLIVFFSLRKISIYRCFLCIKDRQCRSQELLRVAMRAERLFRPRLLEFLELALSDHNLENLAFSNAFYIKTYPNQSYQRLSYSVRLNIHHYFQRVTKLNVCVLHVLLY